MDGKITNSGENVDGGRSSEIEICISFTNNNVFIFYYIKLNKVK